MKNVLQKWVRRSSATLILACGLTNTAQSQQSNWVDVMNSPNANYAAVKQAFYNDWNGISYKKGHGWKQFHRWEAFWETRIKADGSFPNFKQAFNEHKGYMTTHGLAKNGQNGGNWLPLGPFSYTNTQSWSPGMGRVNFIVEDPNNSSTLYIGAPAGGIWKSTDTGSTWTPLGDDLAVMGVSSIGISAANSNTIYLATGDADGGNTYSIGVLKSLDAGLTWNEVGNLNGNLRDIVVDPNNEDIAYVAASNGLYKTTNGGANWSLSQSGSFRDLEMKPGNSQVVYAATSEDIYYTTNGGGNWSLSGGVPSNNGRIGLAVTEGNNAYVYALIANSGNGYKGIYRSNNSGVSFSARNTTTDVFGGSTQAWYDMAIGVSSTNPEVVFTGCLDVWRSTNGGSTISQINNWSSPNQASYTHADIHCLRSYNGNIYCGSDGGVYRSTNDGSSFTDLTDGVQIGQFYTIAGSQNDVTTIAGGLQDNGGFVYNNNSWKVYYGADGMGSAVSPTNSNLVYGMIQYGDLYRTTNGGGNLQQLGSPQGGRWVTPMEHDPNSARIVAGFDDLYEYNGGWNQLSTFNFPEKLRSIEIYDGNSSIMYVSTGSQIYKTTNNGGTMTNVTNGLSSILSGNIITSIEVDPSDDNTLWVSIGGWSSGNKVAKSTNGGSTWTNVSGSLPNLPCNIVKLESTSPSQNAIYVGMDIGVYYSDDALGDFIPYMVNLPNVIVNDLEINEAAGVIRAGTYGRGVWESTSYSVSIENDDAGIASIESPNGSLCGDQITPEVTLTNYGLASLTQVDIEYQLDNGPVSTFSWTGTLASNGSVSVTLPTFTASGPHAFSAWTSNPNGVVDPNTGNDTSNVNFNAIANGTLVYTQLFEDCWGSEVTWTIEDASNNAVLSGGPYSDGNGGNMNLDSVCLQDACYDFIINDSYGDGLGGSAEASCNVDGNYYVISETNDTLVEMPVANFGNQTSHNFCLSGAGAASFTADVTQVCEGASVTFTDASTGATDWSWDFGAGASPATATGVGPHTVTYSAAGASTTSLTINAGASTETETITVNALPAVPTITSNGATTFCDGGSVTLTSSEATGNAWSTAETTQGITVTTSGNYSIEYTDGNGCSSSSASTSVTVESAPSVTATASNPTACSTATGSISIAGSGTGVVTWSGSASGNSGTVSLPYSVTGLAAGSYTVEFTTSTGCVSNAINESLSDPSAPSVPVITTSGATSFCDGGSVTLTSSVVSGNVWSTSATGQTVSVTMSGSYSVTYTDGSGCSAVSIPVVVTVNALPSAPSISAGGATTFCNGGSVDLTSSEASGNMWSTAETGATITATSSGSYTVEYTDGNGCSATSAPMTVTVNALPAVPTISASGATTFCDGESVDLSSSETNGNIWSTSETAATINVTSAGSYTVEYTDGNGCSATSSPMAVTVNALPTVSITPVDSLCNYSGVVDLVGSPSGGTFSGTGVTGTQFDPSVAGNGVHTVDYEYVDGNGCEGTSTIDIFVDGCAGIEDHVAATLLVYPNPMLNELNIELEGDFKVEIVDASGREVLTTEGTNVLNISTIDISSGVYFVNIKSEVLNKNVRIVKE